MVIDLVLFGNMCSGKTSVGQILRNEGGFEVVSAKEVIERSLSTAGEDVRRQRAKGFLLPDPLIVGWIFAGLDAALATGRPVILDGFPRTAPQAQALLDGGHRPNRVVHLDFDLTVIRRRFESRLLCDGCPMPYSTRFTDFDSRCVYCSSRSFHPRPTDRPDYFEVKTGQFRDVSVQVLPKLRSAGIPFVTVGDHGTLAGLRAETLSLLNHHGN